MGLLDGLGGGGGGILGGLGQLIDPLGLLGGLGGGQGGEKAEGGKAAGGGDGLNKILDPLGIFPMVKNAIDSEMHKEAPAGDDKIKAEAAKAMEAAGLAKNVANKWKDLGNDDHSGTTPDAHKEAETNYQPSPDKTKQDDGYSKDGAQGAVTKNQSAMTEAEAFEKAEYEREQKYLNQLKSDFTGLERETFDATDGVAYFHNLESISNDSRQSQVMREAAKYLLDHPEAYNLIVQASGRQDGGITRDGLAAYIEARQTAQQPPTPPEGTKQDPQPTPTKGSRPSHDVHLKNDHKANSELVNRFIAKQENKATDSTNPYAYKPPTSSSSTTSPTKTTSFEVGLQNLSEKMGSLEDRMNYLTDVVINGSPEDARKAQAELTNLQRQFSNLNDLRKQMYELLSNLQKSFSEMAMSAIRNMR